MGVYGGGAFVFGVMSEVVQLMVEKAEIDGGKDRRGTRDVVKQGAVQRATGVPKNYSGN